MITCDEMSRPTLKDNKTTKLMKKTENDACRSLKQFTKKKNVHKN